MKKILVGLAVLAILGAALSLYLSPSSPLAQVLGAGGVLSILAMLKGGPRGKKPGIDSLSPHAQSAIRSAKDSAVSSGVDAGLEALHHLHGSGGQGGNGGGGPGGG